MASPSTGSGVALRLIRQATIQFASKGYAATSIDDVVAGANLTKGAFYYYFDAKEDLLFAIYQQVIEAELDSLARVLDRHLTPSEAVIELIRDVILTTAAHQDNVVVYLREMHTLSPSKSSALRASRNRYHTAFRKILSDGIADGSFAENLNTELATIAFFGLLHHYYVWYRADHRPFDDQQFISESTTWFLRSLTAR